MCSADLCDACVHTRWSRALYLPTVHVGVQSVKLESRHVEGKTGWKTDKMFENGRPVLWAPAKVWEALEHQHLLVPGSGTEQSVKVSEHQGASSISWIFVPTFNRYHAKPDKQMLLDWANAMPEGQPYIRFIVIKPIPAEEQVAEPSSHANTRLF